MQQRQTISNQYSSGVRVAPEPARAPVALSPLSQLYNILQPPETRNTVRLAAVPLSIPLSSTLSNSHDSMLTSLISQLLQPESATMQSFLNQNVLVHPTDEQIAENTTFRAATAHEDDNCAICLDPIEEHQPLCCLNHCRHKFHQDCIMTWFTTNVRCPTCRHDIREP